MNLSSLSAPFVLTLDVGSSSVRTLVFDREGNKVPGLGQSIPYQVRTTPEGGAELDAGILFEQTLTCLENTLPQLTELAGEMAGVGVTTFWHSLVGVDGQGQAVTPVYMWSDLRARAEAEELRQVLPEREIHRRTGCVLHASYLPAKLLWLQRNHPALYDRAAWWMSWGEYLFLRLFRRRICSLSMASGSGLLDQRTMTWDEELLRTLQLDPSQLSSLVDFHDSCTGIEERYARRLGFLSRLPWFPPVGDGACSNIGSGCTSPQRIALMVGTSGAMRILFSGGQGEPPWGLWYYRVDRQRYLLGGALSNGGNLYAWLTRTLQLPGPDETEEALLARRPAGHRLTVLPFLAGERNPGWALDARGVIDGLRLHTRPLDILQACLEAVAYRFALIHRLLQPVAPQAGQIVASGGFLHSRAWVQIMADVLGKPVIASAEPEASSRGVALLVLETLGLLSNITDAPVRLGQTCTPRPGYHQAHQEALERHTQLYQQLIHRSYL
ncbi:MAG: carbohydrate kinase [Nitrospinota bacterium]|nr:MAG: carbohydrate kinase [Nitrospinota bacterium]